MFSILHFQNKSRSFLEKLFVPDLSDIEAMTGVVGVDPFTTDRFMYFGKCKTDKIGAFT